MSNIAEELRSLAFEARKENSVGRLDHYIKARDEAFDIITDGVMDKIRDAAKEGRFRHSAYEWVNQPRDTENEAGQENDTQVFFGVDETGKNGIHIMALLNPAGIPYEQQLIFKLRQYFNPSDEQEQEQEGAEDGRRTHRLKVYLNRRPNNPRQCSLVVSWDRRQQTQRFQHNEGGRRPGGRPQVVQQGRGGYNGVRRTYVGRPRQ